MIDLTRLRNQLATAKVRETDFALFQVVNQLIQAVKENFSETGDSADSSANTLAQLLLQTFLTAENETAFLTNSRELIAGSGITFDDSVAGERTVINSVSGGGIWTPLSDGDPIQPEVIFDSFGQVVMVFVAYP